MAPKIFIVVGSLRRGGAERQMVEFARSAHPEHAQVTFVCLVEEGELADEVRATGARAEVLGIRKPRYDRALRKAVRLLRTERPDALYALNYHGYVYSFPLARLVYPTAARVAGRRATPAFDIAGVPGSRRARLAADRLADAVITNSPSLRDEWLAENPRLQGRIVVVPNGVRVPEVDPAPPPSGGRLRLLSVGTLVANKGQSVLLNAVAALGDRDRWALDLVGDGPDRAALEEQAATLGLSDRVTLHGSLPGPDVHALLRSTAIAVLPSYTEGLPNAVMEAMAHGVAVVASDVGGVPQLLGGGAGLMVPPGDADALSNALARLMDDPEQRAALGAVGRTTIEQSYSVRAMRDATLAAIQSAIYKRR
jgi:glycosyltransferase involved in cell wall biosynthesis